MCLGFESTQRLLPTTLAFENIRAYASDQYLKMAFMTQPTTQLQAFADDPRVQQLSAHLPGFNLLKDLRVSRNELAHSRLLAALLNPHTHRSAYTILRRLLLKLMKDDELSLHAQEQLAAILGDDGEPAQVTVAR